jgi:monoterpene epsilon-lactone hydrolase
MTDTGLDPATADREVTRTIGVPTSISPEAQMFLSLTAQFGGGSTESPTDTAGWHAMIQASNEQLLAVLGPQVQDLPIAVAERTMADVPVFVLTPDGVADDPDQPIYLNIHGGGLIMGGGEACRVMALQATNVAQMTTWSLDYRMPPDHPYPAALDDCLAVYRELLTVRSPDRIVVGGGSAGGNLAAALVLRARDEGLPLPAALLLLTPEADLTESGDTFQTNLGIDTVLTASLADSIALYAGAQDLRHPYLSPLFGDLAAPFPPTFLQAGTRDLFLSNTVLMHRKLRSGGVDAQLHVFEAMPHGGFFGAPEDAELAAEVRRFLATYLTDPLAVAAPLRGSSRTETRPWPGGSSRSSSPAQY